MVGGIIKKIVKNKVLLEHGRDQSWRTVDIESAKIMEPGDTLWWQGYTGFWTPHERGPNKSDIDIGRCTPTENPGYVVIEDDS